MNTSVDHAWYDFASASTQLQKKNPPLEQTFGESMLPTFAMSTEWIIEDVLSMRLGRPLTRGEIIVLTSPRAPPQQICKRVIGLPGDVVCVDPMGKYAPSTEHCVIPEGHMWIVGDNAAASVDSRTYGPVPIALARSRVLARVRSLFRFFLGSRARSSETKRQC
ncbi:hypothetical protein EW145_g7011 [Phellinidium pouzarii]|uniref:Peptidase S26 domain-containing protein n=1 Tax=Phellinidium pouzarii TaxID=167371 RepID=A0A4S4KRG1_9AGAM|nr:hypothetical protein EW145_g7011 [Phellinidium pouzarii]